MKADDRVFIVVAATLVLVSLSIVFALSSLKGQEHFTELYFSEAISSASSGEEKTVSFTIENHEGKETSYSYTVSLNGADAAAGKVAIASGGKKTIEESIVFSSAGEVFLKVDITDPKELDIAQWVAVE